MARDPPTGSWDIHKRILRPSFYLLDKLGFESSPAGEGTEGGVVLIEFHESNGEIQVQYYYTDVFVLRLFYCDAIVRRDKARQKSVEKIFPGWLRGIGSERLALPKAAFLKPKTADGLLALMGMHSNESFAWKHQAIQVISNAIGFEQLSLPDGLTNRMMRDIMLEELLAICDEGRLDAGPLSPLKSEC